jgi:hypothetical protein
MHEHSMCLRLHRRHRRLSIHPVPIPCLNRRTDLFRRQHQARHLRHQAPSRVVTLRRLRMKSRVPPLDLSERPPQKRARFIITEAASREPHGLIIAAIHLVFVSLSRSRPRSTGRRSCGGPAIMIMHPVNLGVGVPGGEGMGGPLGITGTKDAPPSIGLRADCLQTALVALSLGALTALGEGQKSGCASRKARGRRALGS